MVCPFCAEQIKEEAIVCRYCRRDLTSIRPFAQQLEGIKNTLSELHASVASRPSGVAPLQRGGGDIAPTAAVFSSILLAFGLCWMSWQPLPGDVIENFLALVAPFFAAVGLGCVSIRRRALDYGILGFISGAGGLAQFFVVWALCALQSTVNNTISLLLTPTSHLLLVPAPLVPKRWYISVVVYPLAGMVLFALGGKAGEILGRRGRPEHEEAFPAGQSTNRFKDDRDPIQWLKTFAPYFSVLVTGAVAIVTAIIEAESKPIASH